MKISCTAAGANPPTVVSTSDHPYLSPPSRLLVTHDRLRRLEDEGERVAICVWDAINVPAGGLNPSAAGLDTGLLADRSEGFYAYAPDAFYPEVKAVTIDIPQIRRKLLTVLHAFTNLKSQVRNRNAETILGRFDKLAAKYEEVLSARMSSFATYAEILPFLYEILGFDALSRFVRPRLFSGHDGWLRDHVADCMSATDGTAWSLHELMRSGVFEKRLFRTPTGSTIDVNSVSLQWLETEVRGGRVLPSCEVAFWALALSEIKHFGNDYGFFKRLDQLPQFAGCGSLQLTEHNEDGHSLFSLVTNRQFRVFASGETTVVQRVPVRKDTRLDSLPMAYLHAGSVSNNGTLPESQIIIHHGIATA